MVLNIAHHDYRNHGFAIGIVTNPDVETDEWMFDKADAGCSYQMYIASHGSRSGPTGIYAMK